MIETTGVGVISGFDVDGSAGDLARYGSAPSSSVNPTYVYYSGHGDLAAEADQAGTRTSMLRLDAFGQPLAVIPGSGTSELFTGRWDKKTDLVTGLIEMGVRPYDPNLGRFYAADPVDGGSANEYEYSGQDPINAGDLEGERITGIRCGFDFNGRWGVPGERFCVDEDVRPELAYDSKKDYSSDPVKSLGSYAGIFNEPSYYHDVCYGSQIERKRCDDDFRGRMRHACLTTWQGWNPIGGAWWNPFKGPGGCLSTAEAAYRVIRHEGQSHYKLRY